MNAWLHLLNEKIRGYTPDWRAIGASIWGEAEVPLDSISARSINA
jgi:hypothetical protein